MKKVIGLILVLILIAAGTILTDFFSAKADPIDYISLYSQQKGASWLGSDRGYSLGYWDKQLEPYGVAVKQYSWKGVSGRGCRLLSYAHAVQYLTGQKANEKRMIEILAEFLNQNNDPPSADANVAYRNYVINHYGSQYGIRQVKSLDKKKWEEVTEHFDNGGAIVFSSVGHIALAVGYCEKTINNKDMKFIEIVDSAASATVKRTPSQQVYDYKSFAVLTFDSFKVKDAAGHYWMNYEDFAQKMQIHAAFVSTTAASTLNTMRKSTSLGIENNGYYRVKAYRASFREYPYSNAPVKGLYAIQNIANVSEEDLFEIVDTVQNTNGEIWYKTANGWYVNPDEMEFLYRLQAEVDITAKTNQKALNELPLADSRETISLGGTIYVRLTGKYINKHNNTWYKTEQGFVNINNLMDMQCNAIITFENVTAPSGTLPIGKKFNLTGTIKSSETITCVTARILNVDLLRIEQSKTVRPNQQNVNLADTEIVKNGLHFENLLEGNYYYEVDVTTTSGYTEFIKASRFTVGGATPPIDTKIKSITLKIGNGLLLPGEEYRQYFYDSDIGNTFTLVTEVYPYDAVNKSLNWSSSNTKVATVNAQRETVTLIGPGVTTITVSAKDGSNVSASFQIEVVCMHSKTNWVVVTQPTGHSEGMEVEKCSICGTILHEFSLPMIDVAVSSITMPGLQTIRPGSSWYGMDTTERTDWAVLNLNVGDVYPLNPTVSPADADCRDLLYEVYYNDIATIDSRGMITAKQIGKTTMQIYAADGWGASAGVLVQVNPKAWELTETSDTVGNTHEVTTIYNMNLSEDEDGYAEAVIHPAASGLYTVYAYGSCVASATINPGEQIGTPFELERATSGRQGFETLIWLDAGQSYNIIVTEAERESYTNVTIGFRYTFSSFTAVTELPVDGTNKTVTISTAGQTAYFRLRSSGEGIYTLTSVGSENAVCTLYNACGNTITRVQSQTEYGEIPEESGFILSRHIFNAETVQYYGVRFLDPEKTGTITLRMNKHASGNMTQLILNEDVIVPYDVETGIGQMSFTPEMTDYYLMHCWSDEPTVTLYDDAWRKLQKDIYPPESILHPVIYYLTAGQTYYFEALEADSYASTYYTIEQAVHAETISVENLELQPGENGEFSATVYPEDTTIRTVVYNEEFSNVCDVGYDGTVTAKASGMTEIHAQAESDASVTDDAFVIVHGAADFRITSNAYVSEMGELTFHVQITASDDDRYDGFEITMPESRNDLNGWFDLVGATVTDRNGNNISDQVSITHVNETASGFRVDCKGINLNGTEFTVHMLDHYASDFLGQTLTIPIQTKLFMDADGEMIVLQKDITANTSITTTYPNQLQIPPQVIFINVPVLLPGDSADLTCSFSPWNTSLKEVIFDEIDNEVCTVTSNGHVTAKAGGVSTVSAHSKDMPNVSAEVKLSVLHEPVSARFEGSAEMNGDLVITMTVSGSPEDSFDGFYCWLFSDAELELYDTKAVDKNGNRLGIDGFIFSENISNEISSRYKHILQAMPYIGNKTYPVDGTRITFRFKDRGNNASPGHSNRYEIQNLQLGRILMGGESTPVFNSELIVRYPDIFQETVTDFTLNNLIMTSTGMGQFSYEVTPAEMTSHIVFDEIDNDVCEVMSNGRVFAKQNGCIMVTAHASDAPYLEREAILWIHDLFTVDNRCSVTADGDVEMAFTLHGGTGDRISDFQFQMDEIGEDTEYILAGCTVRDKNGNLLPIEEEMYHYYDPVEGEEGSNTFHVMHRDSNYMDARIPVDGTVITFRIASKALEDKLESTEQIVLRNVKVSYRISSVLIPDYPVIKSSPIEGVWEHTITYPSQRDVMNGADFVAPMELTVIEKEAFAGTKFRRVRLGDKVISIGSKSFTECPLLLQIYIPPTCRSIASDAFDEWKELTIYGEENSYAEFYATRYGYGFHSVQ